MMSTLEDAPARHLLWASVSALMQMHYGEEKITRLAAECGFGQATATRIKQRETSVGLDVLDKIAQRFGLQPWQLLVPGFDAADPPSLQPITESERMLYARLRELGTLIARQPAPPPWKKED